MEKLITIKTAASGKQYVHNRAQSPEMCDIADKYGCIGYRNDYRDTTVYTCGLDGYWFFDDLNTAKKYISEALPVLERDVDEWQKYEAECKKQQDEFDERQYQIMRKKQDDFTKKYPRGKLKKIAIYLKQPTGQDDESVVVHARIYNLDDWDDVISAALDRGVARLIGSKKYFFFGESEAFGHDFFGRVGSACPSGGTILDQRIWADFI